MKTELGNSRLIYKQIKLSELDFDLYLSEINSFIEESPKLMKSNELVYLYFFSKSSSENFSESVIWLAVEVVGFTSKDLLEESGLGTKDLDASLVISVKGPREFTVKAIAEAESLARGNQNFVDTWRICLDFKKTNGSVLQFWQ